MNTVKKGSKVLVKGKSGIFTIATGEIHSRNRIAVLSESGKRSQVSLRSVKSLTPANSRIITQYNKLMSW